jgi:Protein of unknown function (DUF1579)
MRFWSLLLLASFVVAFPAVVGASGAQQTSGQDKPMMGKQMMDIMVKYGMPGKNHDFLKKYVGDWDIEVKNWAAPGAEPITSKASEKFRLIFDGRFLEGQFEGMMMGQGFQGRQIIGYDLYQNKYVSFWIDSMSTPFFLTTGMLNAAGNVMTETGTWPEAMTGGTQKVKFVTTFMMDGKYTFEMFTSAPDGKEFKSMQLTGTRKM